MSTATNESSRVRIESIDALRGFDMFWILGADSLVVSLRQLTDARPVALLADQLEHVDWEGFHFYDLIFPLFVFLMGASTVFSLTKIIEEQGRGAAYSRVFRRFAILYALGLLYHGGMSRDGGPEMFRYMGVLHRIAICYLFGGLLFINLRFRGLLIACVALLVGYWAVMTFVPVPEHGAGVYSEGKNLANYIDQHYLPGYKWDGDWDPEGILSSFPAVASGLLGVFAGLLIRRDDLTDMKKVGYLAMVGLVCLGLGHLWGLQFPIIKKLWTSSYVLVAGGWSYLLLALFYLIIDVWKLRTWSRPFVWIGMNCITIYMLNNLVGDFSAIVRRVIHAPAEAAMAPWGSLVISIFALSLAIWICWFMYRKKIFLRI
ncbi:MAG: acyltransferase family protein [Aeoliella sp.]